MKTLLIVMLLGLQARAQTIYDYDTNNVMVQTLAGSAFTGYFDGQGTQTMFDEPSAVVADSAGNLFVMDVYNYRIRKITPDGAVSTFAGGTNYGNHPPGYGTSVGLDDMRRGQSMIIDKSNTLWITTYNGGFFQVTSDAYVSATRSPGFYIGGMCVDSGNNVYVSNDNKIWRVRPNGSLEPFAGSGNSGTNDGNGIFTSFYNPTALAADAADNIYVFDSGTRLIRKIDQNTNVTTITTCYGNVVFDQVYNMFVDASGNLIMAHGISILKATLADIRCGGIGGIVAIAGSFNSPGYANGPGSSALFNNAVGVCEAQGSIFVADTGNQRIRKITFNPQPEPVTGANLLLNTYPGLQITGVVGRAYRIESSKDLSAWQAETTIFLTITPYLWIDQAAVGQRKFYRAFLLP